MSHCVAVRQSSLGGFPHEELPNPKGGGSPRCSMWRCSVRCSQFNHWIPWTLTASIPMERRELFPIESEGLCCAPLERRLLFKARFHRRNSLLAPVSTRNGCLIAPCSQLHPVETESTQCGQIRSQF